jgi:hypothetical protein
MKPVVICACTLMLGIGGLTAGVVSQLHVSTGEIQTAAANTPDAPAGVSLSSQRVADAKSSDPRMVAEHITATPAPRDASRVAVRLASR